MALDQVELRAVVDTSIRLDESWDEPSKSGTSKHEKWCLHLAGYLLEKGSSGGAAVLQLRPC